MMMKLYRVSRFHCVRLSAEVQLIRTCGGGNLVPLPPQCALSPLPMIAQAYYLPSMAAGDRTVVLTMRAQRMRPILWQVASWSNLSSVSPERQLHLERGVIRSAFLATQVRQKVQVSTTNCLARTPSTVMRSSSSSFPELKAQTLFYSLQQICRSWQSGAAMATAVSTRRMVGKSFIYLKLQARSINSLYIICKLRPAYRNGEELVSNCWQGPLQQANHSRMKELQQQRICLNHKNKTQVLVRRVKLQLLTSYRNKTIKIIHSISSPMKLLALRLLRKICLRLRSFSFFSCSTCPRMYVCPKGFISAFLEMKRLILLLMQTLPPMRADSSIFVSLCSFSKRSASNASSIRCPFSYSPEYFSAVPSDPGRFPSLRRNGSDFFLRSLVERNDSSPSRPSRPCPSFSFPKECGRPSRSSLISAFPWRSLKLIFSLSSRPRPNFRPTQLLRMLPLMDSGLSMVAREWFTRYVCTSAVSIRLCPCDSPRSLLTLRFPGPASAALSPLSPLSLWSSSMRFLATGSSRCVFAEGSAWRSALSAWMRIMMGEQPGFLELQVLLGLLSGLSTLKKPVTSSSSGMVCLSRPWKRSCTVRI